MDKPICTPLEHKDSIRLLGLLLATEDEPESLRGEFTTAQLSDPGMPAYEALSYMWGPQDSDNESPLFVGAREIMLRKSPSDALFVIRPLKTKVKKVTMKYVPLDQFDLHTAGQHS